MKVGFIGAGNMATAIVEGAKKSSLLTQGISELRVYDKDESKSLSWAEKYSAIVCGDAKEVANESEIIALAVKPHILESVLTDISETVKLKDVCIVSIAAGKTIEFIESKLGFKAPIARVMPSINAKVLEAVSAFCSNDLVSLERESFIKTLFESVGSLIEIEETFFPLFGVSSGSAAAFTYMYIDSLARAGLKNGMSKSMALDIAARTVMGSAKMIIESNEHPWELIDQVCSPGGTTIEGIFKLQKNGFEASVIEAVDAGVAKDKKI